MSKKEIEHIAWLARIEISKKELELFSKQLNDILAYFAKIDEVDTENIPPSYHVLDLVNVFRKDDVKPSLPEEIFQITPQTKEKFVKAPRMA
ncbi:MAG: Asp-tRNA(Asn)/Glu-tRNA(Gln) amidotransferase subunit GatC [archaeon]|nr:Asp-tRNA(Asn)/Glu-tRNA(Gln) amidotransferase subunit GatC [archaeon]